jgi:hypothetical protein
MFGKISYLMTNNTLYRDLRWEVQQRLQFIEARLFWQGRFNRRSIVEYFGISGVQATSDISRYSEIAPQNLIYDRSKKTYLATDEFEPVLIEPKPESLLYLESESIQGSSFSIPWEGLPTLHRNVDKKVFRRVLQAIQDQKSIEVRYQSMSNPEPSWRWISPHSIAHDGMRWHVRAYCFIDNTFKDFLLARLLEFGKERESIVFKEEDLDWNAHVNLRIVAHTGLSKDQKKVIETDYGMKDGALTVNVRRALLPYFLKKHSLNIEKEKPEEQQISIENRDEIPLFDT